MIPKIENKGGETTLSDTLPDQSPLDGILNKVRDLGLSIITHHGPASAANVERWAAMERFHIQRPRSKRWELLIGNVAYASILVRG